MKLFKDQSSKDKWVDVCHTYLVIHRESKKAAAILMNLLGTVQVSPSAVLVFGSESINLFFNCAMSGSHSKFKLFISQTVVSVN